MAQGIMEKHYKIVKIPRPLALRIEPFAEPCWINIDYKNFLRDATLPLKVCFFSVRLCK